MKYILPVSAVLLSLYGITPFGHMSLSAFIQLCLMYLTRLSGCGETL
jgi:hypothetical protein